MRARIEAGATQHAAPPAPNMLRLLTAAAAVISATHDAVWAYLVAAARVLLQTSRLPVAPTERREQSVSVWDLACGVESLPSARS